VIHRLKQTISKRRVTVLIVDDSISARNRRKSVELLAKVFDHSTRQFVNGFQRLTLGWSQGLSPYFCVRKLSNEFTIFQIKLLIV
jgi:hypothetical protein